MFLLRQTREAGCVAGMGFASILGVWDTLNTLLSYGFMSLRLTVITSSSVDLEYTTPLMTVVGTPTQLRFLGQKVYLGKSTIPKAISRTTHLFHLTVKSHLAGPACSPFLIQVRRPLPVDAVVVAALVVRVGLEPAGALAPGRGLGDLAEGRDFLTGCTKEKGLLIQTFK